MTHDTTKDPRIIVAHLASTLLKKYVKHKPEGLPLRVSRDKLTELAAACDSAVMSLMYSYLEPQALAASEPLTNLNDTAKALAEAYEKVIANKDDRSILRANIRWCLRTFNGLKDRFGNPGATIASGIDLLAVHVRNVAKSGNFLKTRVTDGNADYAVVTNLTDVKTDSVLAASFLPPREIGGIISEAMFLGSDKRAEAAGTFLSEKEVDAKEAASILFESISHPPR
jgi:predicted RNA-binding protein with EMAP domain